MTELSKAAAKMALDPAYGFNADPLARTAIKALTLYLASKGVIDVDEYKAFIKDVVSDANQMIDDGAMSDFDKDMQKNTKRQLGYLTSFIDHL